MRMTEPGYYLALWATDHWIHKNCLEGQRNAKLKGGNKESGF